jgi:hypothetical protein
MIAGGPPLLLSDGNYALLVYDSTAAPPGHGPSDSRLTDPRNADLQPGNRPSGLGHGTVEITVTPSGGVGNLIWEIDGVEYGGLLQIARPLS